MVLARAPMPVDGGASPSALARVFVAGWCARRQCRQPFTVVVDTSHLHAGGVVRYCTATCARRDQRRRNRWARLEPWRRGRLLWDLLAQREQDLLIGTCLRKRAHSRSRADSVVSEWVRQGSPGFAYRCPLCNQWHVSHEDGDEVARARVLLVRDRLAMRPEDGHALRDFSARWRKEGRWRR